LSSFLHTRLTLRIRRAACLRSARSEWTSRGSRSLRSGSEAMGLPPELLVCAENFYRRFPEEFIALGAPGLEEIFDLRLDGTRSRRISETPAEKTVQITIRRWPAAMAIQAPMPPAPQCDPRMMMGPQAWMTMPPYAVPDVRWGTSPLQASGAPPPAVVPAAAAAADGPPVSAQLDRLEAALAALRPRVEVAMGRSGTGAPAMPPEKQAGDEDVTANGDHDCLLSPLRSRRRMPQLAIVAPDRGAQAQTLFGPTVKMLAPEE